jgi:hypothetical protein
VIPVVEKEPLDHDREVRLEAAPPSVLPDFTVVILDELDPGVPREVLRILGAEVGPPTRMGDHLLDELQVPAEQLLGGQVVGRGGEGGHANDWLRDGEDSIETSAAAGS